MYGYVVEGGIERLLSHGNTFTRIGPTGLREGRCFMLDQARQHNWPRGIGRSLSLR